MNETKSTLIHRAKAGHKKYLPEKIKDSKSAQMQIEKDTAEFLAKGGNIEPVECTILSAPEYMQREYRITRGYNKVQHDKHLRSKKALHA